jgi:hypothetical protein
MGVAGRPPSCVAVTWLVLARGRAYNLDGVRAEPPDPLPRMRRREFSPD